MKITHSVAPPGFCNRGEVRYGVYRGSRVRSLPVPVVLSVYQRGSLLDGLAMYLSCDKKKFHDNESTHILHNFWTSTHRGEATEHARIFSELVQRGCQMWFFKCGIMLPKGREKRR